MTVYKVTPFSGEWDEDPKNFLGWFLQCMGAADDVRKAHDFVYYLQAGSDADEWFDNLLDEEKRSWVTIEVLFRRRWLNEEDISTKDSAARKNEHLPNIQPPHYCHFHPNQPLFCFTNLLFNPGNPNKHSMHY